MISGSMFDVNYSNSVANLLKLCIGMQDFSRLVHVCHYVFETQKLEGDIVEFGCFVGNTAKLITSITTKQIYVYDSFEGLPESFEGHPGEMKVTSEALIQNFNNDNIRLPIIYKGWFNEIKPEQIPNKISFAHLDGDLYDSTIQPLNLIYNNIVPGGVILIDDYGADCWYGVKKAAEEFFADKPETIVELSGINGQPSFKALIKKL